METPKLKKWIHLKADIVQAGVGIVCVLTMAVFVASWVP